MARKPDPKELAERLRANLRRRKQQQKARAPRQPPQPQAPQKQPKNDDSGKK